MKKLAKFLLNSIVEDPKKVEINQKEEEGLSILNIKVPSENIGKVIGKNGRTIKALTSLIRIKAIKEGKRINLEVQENKD